MADLVLSVVLAGFPHISPYGVLLGAIFIMGIGLAIAIKSPPKK